MTADLLFAGHYRGPETFLGTYTFLKLYPEERWVFAESQDPAYDFPGRVAGMDWDALGKQLAQSWLDEGKTRLCWGRFTRGQDVPALNWGGEEVGRIADALELTCWSESRGEFRCMQVEVIGLGRLRPTTHEVDLVFVPDEPA